MAETPSHEPSRPQAFQDMGRAPRDGTTIEVKHGMHQEIVRAGWDDQKQAFIREDDPDRRTLHRVTEWRPVTGEGTPS